MGTGYSGIIVPTKTSMWELFIEDVRGEFNGNASSLQTVAAVLRRDLPHAQNVRSRWLGKADLRIAAVMIARKLNHAAASQNAAASALTEANQIFLGTFSGGGPNPHTGRSSFNAGA